MNIKDRIQKEAVNAWYLADCKASIEFATGVGKTRVGVLAAGWVVKQKPKARVLIITPTQTIRDLAWAEEFVKWGANDIFDYNVECLCIQSAYKLVGEHYDMVICDEIHNFLYPEDAEEYEYFKFFENNTYDKILGLSATIDKSLLKCLDTIAPIVMSIDTNKALDLGLVSPFKIYNIPVDMTIEERLEYSKQDKEFKATFEVFDNNLNTMFACLKNKVTFRGHLVRRYHVNASDRNACDDIFNKYKSYAVRCNAAMRKRKSIIYDSEAKLSAIESIIKMFGKHYGVIFNQTADFADRVGELIGDTCIVEHSKIKPKKKRVDNLNKFKDGRSKVCHISTVKSLNEGANLPRVDFIIIASGTSKLRDFTQRAGRSIRLEDGKEAMIVRLYVNDSQEEKWVASSQEGYKVIVLNEYKELESYVRTRDEELSRDDD